MNCVTSINPIFLVGILDCVLYADGAMMDPASSSRHYEFQDGWIRDAPIQGAR